MKWLKRLFRRKPKGYRFPNGIPAIRTTTLDLCLFPDAAGGLNSEGWSVIGYLPSGAPVYARPSHFGTKSDRPWVIFEDGDDK